MASDTFIDTSGFYALLVGGDERHSQAASFMRQASEKRKRFLTTDYVVDETATLLQARGLHGLIHSFFDSVFTSDACRVVWMDADRFQRTRAFFLRNLRRDWSFTDCMSFVVMRELRVREGLTKDAHFEDAGFVALLREDRSRGRR